MLIDDLATPAVLIDRSRLEANLARMQRRADDQGVALRPHVKTHKSLTLARRQRDLGARGLTVATVEEAETFVAGGFDDVRVAYPVVGADKLGRLQALRDRARVSFCVDTRAGADAASAFFAGQDAPVEVLMEVDTGHGRCGVPWDARDAAALARHVAALPGLRLAGLLTHAGHAYHGPHEGETPEAALRRVAAEERDRMLAAAVRLRDAGVVDGPDGFELSIGSTPSMRHFENRTQDGFRITEIRPGNYVFHDAIQTALGAAALADCAMTVLATVVSKRRDAGGRERLYLDAGKKTLTSDTGAGTDGYGLLLYNPRTMEPLPHAHVTGLSEEHGWVQVAGGATLAVGDRVRLVPNHACVVAGLQDRLVVVEGDEVVGELSVDARGRRVQ